MTKFLEEIVEPGKLDEPFEIKICGWSMNIHTRILIFLSLFFLSCSSIKSIHEKDLDNNKTDKKSILVIKKSKLTHNQSIIYFTEAFDNNIQIEVNQKIIYNRKIETIEQLGYAGSCIIENNKEVIIRIDHKKQIKLNPEELPKYKFIYIEKEGRNYKVEYTNTVKRFL